MLTLNCEACCVGKTTKYSNPKTHLFNKYKEKILSNGQCISCDDYVSSGAGRVVNSTGHRSTCYGYNGGTIFVNHASKYILHCPQQSLDTTKTTCSKLYLEHDANTSRFKIQCYHSDNGIFTCNKQRDHCTTKKQKLLLHLTLDHFSDNPLHALLDVESIIYNNIMMITMNTNHWHKRGSFWGCWAEKNTRPLLLSSINAHSKHLVLSLTLEFCT